MLAIGGGIWLLWASREIGPARWRAGGSASQALMLILAGVATLLNVLYFWR